MYNLEKCLENRFEKKEIANICIRIGQKDKILLESYKSATASLNPYTLFDMASVTKILATTQLAFIAIDKNLLHLEDNVSKFYSYSGDITIRHLLTHTMGIGHKNLCQSNVTYENVAEYILSIPTDIPVGSDVLYSCPGFILLGKIIEKVMHEKLDALFLKYIASPLGLSRTMYLPKERENIVNANIREEEIGIVNDYNCRYLGGVAGNAGLFSCISDLDVFCKMLIRCGAGLYEKDLFLSAAQNHTLNAEESRGLGFVYNDSKNFRTASLFPEGSIGHGGHTGQLLFADYKTGFYGIILTDITKCITKLYGYDYYEEVLNIMRDICTSIEKDIMFLCPPYTKPL